VTAVVYLDSSAGLKLLVKEPESPALRAWLNDRGGWTSSALFRTELVRAARRSHSARVLAAREMIARVAIVDVDTAILNEAADLDPRTLRSLDAIHLATALRVADELEAIVTYDRRMIEGARALGLPVASPA